ncbi:hypothetical protein [Alsobacter sp. R-9]
MRFMIILATGLAFASPAAASVAAPGTARPGLAPVTTTKAQVIIRERRGWDDRDHRRYERRYRRGWDGTTGQICRERVTYRLNRFGERVRRVVRVCR